ncbi:MAG TPA: DNRLRE domain-containing protein, partial [Desulfotomaculum sp.]|nr:DNRLRE domain-containing protein [Desulfotomaculum sp.]
HPPLAPKTEDFVKLASDTRITPTEAIKAYELAVVFRKDPKWIAEVYTQVRDWGRIESALEKYRQNIGRIKGLRRGTGKAQRSESVQKIAAVYRVSPQVIDGWAEAGVDPDVIGTVLFWLDVQASPSDHVYMLDQFLPKDWEMKAKPESKLKEHWPPRRFPSHRLPEINRLLDTAVPQTLTPTVTPIPTMPSFQLGSALESSLGPRSDDVAAPSYPQSYATPQSETAPPPSVIDPGAIYSTGHVSLFKAYFDSSTERVDPSTGALIIRQTDFVLPGRNGLDFALARIYNSQKANTDLPRVRVEVDHYNIQAGSRTWYHDPYPEIEITGTDSWIERYISYTFEYGSQTSYDGRASGWLTIYVEEYFYVGGSLVHVEPNRPVSQYPTTDYPQSSDVWPVYRVEGYTSSETYLDRRYGWGSGWILAFPTLEFTDGKIFLHHENGSTYSIQRLTTGAYDIDRYDLEDLVFRAETPSASNYQASYSLRRKDGLVWYFSGDGVPVCLQDRFGNKIVFQYTTIDGVKRITQVIDSVGRIVSFTYGQSENVIAVSSGGQELFRWRYVLEPIAGTSKKNLVQVIPPAGEPIRYSYVIANAQFTPWVEGVGTGSAVTLRYSNMETVTHPTHGVTVYEYGLASKDLDNDEPGDQNPSELQYYRVTSRKDRTSGADVNRSTFAYGEWSATFSYYETVRTGESILGAPVVEKWRFNQDHLVIWHELSGNVRMVSDFNPDAVATESIATSYEYLGRQLPVRETRTIKVGADERSEEARYEWDLCGNLLATVDALGRRTEITYDPAYSLPILKVELTDTVARRGRVTRQTLELGGRRVKSVERFMGHESYAGDASYTGPTLPTFNTGESWTWSPPRPIRQFTVAVYWHEGWCSYVQYKVEYRSAGSSSWTTVKDMTHNHTWLPNDGTDTWTFTLPSVGMYDLRVTSVFGTVGVGSVSAMGPAYNWDPDDPRKVTVTQYRYDGDGSQPTDHPGNIVGVDIGSSASQIESTTVIGYDPVFQAYPASVTAGSVSTSAEYDRLGRVITYTTTQDGTSAITRYEYDPLGRLIGQTLPDGARRSRQYHDALRQVVITDERGHRMRETYDELGRFVKVEWADPDLLPPYSWRTMAEVEYDALGRVSKEKDALGHETTYVYDAFGRKIETLYPDGAVERIWSIDAGPIPPTSPPLPWSYAPPGYAGASLAWWEKLTDADGNDSYRGYDAGGRQIWAVANPRKALPTGFQQVTRTETGSDLAQGLLSGVVAGPTGLQLANNVAETVVFQPGPTDGVDAAVVAAMMDQNMGDEVFLYAGITSGGYRTANSYLRFDLSAISPVATIVRGLLWLYCTPSAGAIQRASALSEPVTDPSAGVGEYTPYVTKGEVPPPPIEVYGPPLVRAESIDSSWSESTITWNNQPAHGGWVGPAVDIYQEGWLSWDVTPLVQQWLTGRRGNYGIALIGIPNDAPGDVPGFCSSEYTDDPALRPKLVLVGSFGSFVLSGSRVSPPLDLSPVGRAFSSSISWQATEPPGTSVVIEVSLDGGLTWQQATNGSTIPGLSPEMDLTGKSLLVRQILSTTDPSRTPILHELVVKVCSRPVNEDQLDWEMVWYEYDALNRVTRVFTRRAQSTPWEETKYTYDYPFDRPSAMELPGHSPPEVRESVHTYEYNARGLKVREDGGLTDEINWSYDTAGRVQEVRYTDGTAVRYTYGGNPSTHVTTATVVEGGTTWSVETWHNLRGWLTQERWLIGGQQYDINYTYDPVGNRVSMTYPDRATVNFEYDERNQLVRIRGFFEGPVAGVWTDSSGFRYDANGFLIGMRSVNGIETTFQPDERNRLKQISSPPLTLTYAYTPGGNVASITDASSGEPFTLTYGYDGANRLISAQVHMPTGIETVQYLYDALGNRIKEAWTDARGVINYGYLPGNYLVQRGSTIYSWGTYGQLVLKDEQPNALGGETNYDYNARRLMTQVRVDGSPVAQFFYDPYGRRVKIVEGDTTTITLYSGNDIVYEIKTQPGQPTVTTKYLAINGKYLTKVVQEGTNPPQTYFYHTDLVGSVRAITDSQGQVVA